MKETMTTLARRSLALLAASAEDILDEGGFLTLYFSLLFLLFGTSCNRMHSVGACGGRNRLGSGFFQSEQASNETARRLPVLID